MRALITALTCLMLFTAPVVAGDFEDANQALNVGEWQKAFRLFKRLAEQGDARALYELGMLYESGFEDVPFNETKSGYWYRKAAEQGDARAQYLLALWYDAGHRVPNPEAHWPQNDTKALELHRKAAEQGVVQSQHWLGMKYVEGAGVRKDIIQAYAWMSVAYAQVGWENKNYFSSTVTAKEWETRTQKDKTAIMKQMSTEQVAEAQKLSSEYWEKYVPFKSDFATPNDFYLSDDAVAVFELLAEAQFTVAEMYFHARGLSEDYVKAGYWYRKAAEKGHTRAQSMLGLLYGLGLGVPDDFVLALAWLDLAIQQGDEIATEGKKELVKNLAKERMIWTAEQVAEAQKLTAEFRWKYLGRFGKF